MNVPLLVVPRRPIVQRVSEAHPTVQPVARGDAAHKLAREPVAVKWLAPNGCSEPLRAAALIALARGH
eukprot:1019398-Pyramimonas_sp.AAC.1